MHIVHQNHPMLHLQVIQVGKTKEKYIKEAVNEYLKRLKSVCKIEIITLKEKKGDKNKIIQQEGKEIIQKINEPAFVVALDVAGHEKSSEEFAKFILELQHNSKITFVIGGAYGLSGDVIKRADYLLSLSRMTFTHQIIRVIFWEQIYRAFTIIEGKSYHH